MKKIKKTLGGRKSVSIVVLFMMAFSAVGMIGFVDLSKAGSFPTPPESGIPGGEEEPSGGDGGNPPNEGESSNPGNIIPPPIEEPDVTSAYASSITADSAVLHGYLSDDGGEACGCYFTWRRIVPIEGPGFSSIAQATIVIDYNSATWYSHTLNKANIYEWEWRTCASNSAGSDCSPWMNFYSGSGGGSNHPPVATDDSYSVNKGETYTAFGSDDTLPIIVYKSSLILPPPLPNGVLENDDDPDGDTLVAHLISGPSHASSFTLELNGGFTYTNNGDGASSDSFVYEANDRKGGTDTATVSLSITEAEPIDDYFTVEENSANNQFDVLVNDIFGFDGLYRLTDHRITSIGTPSHGTAYFDESFVYYTPNPDYSGSDEFTYVAIKAWSTGLRDDPGVVYSATVYVTVGNTVTAEDDSVSTVPHDHMNRLTYSYSHDNDLAHPDFEPYTDAIFYTPDGPWIGYNILDNDDGDSISISNLCGPSGTKSYYSPGGYWYCSGETGNGLVTSFQDGSGCPGTYDIYYQPNSGFQGTDTFTYSIEDGNGNSDSATVTVTVQTIGQSPIVSGIDDQTITEGQDFSPINLWNYGSDPDNIDSELKWIFSQEFMVDYGKIIGVDGVATVSADFPAGGYHSDGSSKWINLWFRVYDKYGNTDYDQVAFTIEENIEPPNKPSIEGGIMVCYTGIEYRFNSVLTNPGSNTKYYFHWDDGVEIPDTDDWTSISGPAPLTLTEVHKWDNAGVYDIKVYVVTDDPVSGLPINLKSLPLPVQVLHKSENPEDG